MKIMTSLFAILAAGVQLSAAEHGLIGEYFPNSTLSGSPIVTSLIPNLNFLNLGTAPVAGVPDDFSARWSGEVVAPTSGVYKFYSNTDDGIRLWVNGVLIIDEWKGNAPTTALGTINLTAGQNVPIVVEYFDDHGGATLQLSWESDDVSKEIIPTSALWASNKYTEIVEPVPEVGPVTGVVVPFIINSITSPAYFEMKVREEASLSTSALFGTANEVQVISRSVRGVNLNLNKWISSIYLARADNKLSLSFVQWVSIDVNSGASYIIRKNDSLLLRGRNTGILHVSNNCGTMQDVPVIGGAKYTYKFNDSGYYNITNRDAQGQDRGSINITVVESPFDGLSTAIEMNYARKYNFKSEPSSDLVKISTSDSSILRASHIDNAPHVSGGVMMTQAFIKPIAFGSAKITARIASTGSLLGLKSVDQYTIVSDLEKGFTYERDESGFGHARLGFTMSPIVPYANVLIEAYVPGFTVNGQTSLVVPASDLDVTGHWDGELILSPWNHMTCHRLTVLAR